MIDGEATTVAGSPAHSAWVSGGNDGAAAPAAPAPAAPVTPTPAAPAAPAAPVTPALPADATLARPGEKASRISDANKAYLDKHKAADRAAKPNASAPAAPAAPASPAAPAAAPAAVAGAIKAGDAAAAAASAAGATPTQAAAAGDAAAEEFLEAQVNGQPFKIPLSAMVPVKVNGKVQLVPLKDAQRGLMMETDYRQKTASVGADRRSLAAEQARIKVEQEQLAADRKEYEDAQTDPEKFEQYQEHLKQLQTNPLYKANWERGRAAALDSAELGAYRGAEQEQVVRDAATSVENTLNTLAAEYPGVDIASVRTEYATDLVNRRAELTEASLRSYFTREAQRVERYTGPLQKQLEALTATVGTLQKEREAATAAATHNDNTRRAIDRDDKGRFTAPSGGTAPDVTREPPPKPFTSHELPARNKAWVDKGRGELRR